MNTKMTDATQGDTIPFEQVIAELTDDDKPLLNASLAYLSDLSRQQIGLLEDAWGNTEFKRRRQIIHRLVELAEDDVSLNFEAIFKHHLNDKDEEIRSTAIEGLWENEDTSLIDPLISLLENDSSEIVQSTAALALGRFAMLAEYRKIAAEYRHRLAHSLLAVFNDDKKPIEVRRRTLEAAASISLKKVKQAIAAAYRNANPSIRASAIYSMGKNCDPYWLPVLMSELNSCDAELRYEAAFACGELGEEEAVPSLITLTDDSDTDVRLAAVQALGKIGGSEAREHLEKCLDNPGEAIRETASQALHELEILAEPLSLNELDYGELDE